VNNISFEAQKGQILGFLGPNGAGKSTTMKMATCYLPPDEGSIHVCGFDAVEQPIEVRKKVGYLPEHNPLYLDMFVHEYLLFIASLHGLKGSNAKRRVSEMIALVGLEREQNKALGALSKGYRQRVGLAQALVHDPEVLILDEPTTGLDPNQIVEIRHVIKSISQDKTVIFSTHIMQEVQALCDRVIIIKLGELVADRPIAQLRQEKAKPTLHLSFQQPVPAADFEGVEGVEAITQKEGNALALRMGTQVDARAAIFNRVVEKGHVLLEMRTEESSLEAIFREFTN